MDHLITARADRIDGYDNGYVLIIDYKTGMAPSKKAVEGGRALQMRVEALIAHDGGFPKVRPHADSIKLFYWKLSGKQNAAGTIADVTPKEDDYNENTRHGLMRLLAAFQSPEQGYRAEPVAREVNPYSDYRHLARVAEWGVMADDGAEDGGDDR